MSLGQHRNMCLISPSNRALCLISMNNFTVVGIKYMKLGEVRIDLLHLREFCGILHLVCNSKTLKSLKQKSNAGIAADSATALFPCP